MTYYRSIEFKRKYVYLTGYDGKVLKLEKSKLELAPESFGSEFIVDIKSHETKITKGNFDG